jgi:hypothetical protein
MRRSIVGAAIVGALLLGGGIAYASIPSTDGTIAACRDLKTGTLRAIDSDLGQVCGKQEASLSWNQTGPAGPQGPAGPPGVSGVHVVTRDLPQGQFGTQETTVNCPTNEVALSATANVQRGGVMELNALADYQAEPVLDANNNHPIGYTMQAQSNDFSAVLRFQVTCAVTS